MPFFKGSKKDMSSRNKLEHKMCLAKDTPEPIFDISECDLTDVPSGVFSMCKVFLKEELLLHNNQLTALKGGGNIYDLSILKVLDLHSNKLSSLPDDIGSAKNLQVLNLADNRLKKLPSSLGNIQFLTNLNINGNKFKEFPQVICKLKHLQFLDIAGNKIKKLPQQLCFLGKLQTLVLDSNFEYPSSDICANGTESIMKFLCSEMDVEYIPPSEVQLEIALDDEKSNSRRASWIETEAVLHQYEKVKEQRRKDLLNMELALRESEESQAQVAMEAAEKRKRLLEDVIYEQDRFDEGMQNIQEKRDREHKQLISALTALEAHSDHLIQQLLLMNERSKNTEALLLSMEKDKLEFEELLNIKQEEYDKFRKKEALAAMQEMMTAEETNRIIREHKMNLSLRSLSSEEQDAKLQEILESRSSDQQALLNKLLNEEELQRKAFEVLQMERDVQHLQITQQIKLIENELAQLTKLELKKKDLKLTDEIYILAEKRATLASLLSTMLEEKDKREKELRLRVVEMEKRKAEEMTDFWFFQYQRLLDLKPKELIELELSLDPTIKYILDLASANDYITLFARKRITLKQLLYMNADDLFRMGLIESNVIEAILNVIRSNETQWMELLKFGDFGPIEPSAPVLLPEEEEAPGASAPELPSSENIQLWTHSECVICLDRESITIFLPCGHLCCCWICAEPLKDCPLCRTAIKNKCRNM